MTVAASHSIPWSTVTQSTNRQVTMWSSHEIIELIAPRIPGVCVSPATWGNIGSLALRLPSVFSAYYLECRLSATQEQVDFLACADVPHDEDAARKTCASLDPMPRDLVHAPAWRFAWQAARRWMDPSFEWSSKIPSLWLEFDHLNTRSAVDQCPSLCVCTDRGYLKRADSSPWDRRSSCSGCLDFVMPVAPLELGGLFCADNRRALATCFQCLPPGGRILYVSFMVAREPATIKLYGAVPRADLAAYLNSIGWSGPFDLLQHVAHTFCTSETADDTAYFDLSLEGEILPHTAISFSQPQLGRWGGTDPRRTALLELLEAEGICAPDKGAALRSWPGSDRESHPGRSIQARIQRWLDVKITVHAEQGLGAKGYLGFAPVLSMF